MSNSTRPGGYDERFVVPLEASRRGAHRARVNPVVAVLPLIAVALVVAGVVALAYTLLSGTVFSGGTDSAGQTPPARDLPVATGSPSVTSQPSRTPEATASASGKPTASARPTRTARVDKSIVLSIFNGSDVRGLSRQAAAALEQEGWKHGEPKNWEGTPVEETTIFYSTADQVASARAVRAVLGVGEVKASPSQAGEGITVVVQSDWTP
jgi:hypothetical protein